MVETIWQRETATVTFRLRDGGGAASAHLAGEFNGWSPDATPMQRDGDGFVVRLALRRGRRYRFRYLLDGQRWVNDWAADAYVSNEYGGDDSVIDLTGVADNEVAGS